MPFKDLPEGTTHFCPACEYEIRGIKPLHPGYIRHACDKGVNSMPIGERELTNRLVCDTGCYNKIKPETIKKAAKAANKEQREMMADYVGGAFEKPSWEEIEKKFLDWFGSNTANKVFIRRALEEIRQTIKEEREQAIEEVISYIGYDQGWE